MKKRILATTFFVALFAVTLASFKLVYVSMSEKNILNNSPLKENETILVATEKEETVEDFSSSSSLNGIYIGESKLQGFTSKKLDYELVLENNPKEIKISVDKQNEEQVVTGIGEIELTQEEQTIEINVVSKDGYNTSTYTIKISYVQNILAKNEYKFEYTGDYQEFEAPYTGYYKMECWGAQGGSYGGTGGKGAYTSGNVYLTKGQKVYVYVGQTGEGLQTETYNGGGKSGALYSTRSGGGATDIRLESGSWDNFDSLKSRIMVAAGGGGSVGPSYSCNGGAGGALVGAAGSKGGTGSGYVIAGGGTQTSGGTAGTGSYTKNAVEAGFGNGGSGDSQHGGGGRRWLLWRWPEASIILVLLVLEQVVHLLFQDIQDVMLYQKSQPQKI
jgi:hypothetical protein